MAKENEAKEKKDEKAAQPKETQAQGAAQAQPGTPAPGAPAGKEGEATQEQEGVMRLQRVEAPDLADEYVNFFTVMGTNEEVVLELGTLGAGNRQQVRVNERCFMSYYTTKRMLAALHRTVLQYEQRFGQIELNVQNRLQGDAAVQAAAQAAAQQQQPAQQDASKT